MADDAGILNATTGDTVLVPGLLVETSPGVWAVAPLSAAAANLGLYSTGVNAWSTFPLTAGWRSFLGTTKAAWDETNGRLGVMTTSPQRNVDVSWFSNGTTTATIPTIRVNNTATTGAYQFAVFELSSKNGAVLGEFFADGGYFVPGGSIFFRATTAHPLCFGHYPAGAEMMISTLSNLVLVKTIGKGIQVDPAAPTFTWRDMLGQIVVKAVGANDPAWAVFRGTNYQHRFTNGLMREVWINFHIPHDYVAGTDLYLHAHWAQIVADTGGGGAVPGNAEWMFDLSYADGFGTAGGAADPFTAPITATVVQQGSTTQYGHMIAEVAITSAGGSATTLDRATIVVDGLLCVRLWTDSSRAAHTLNQDPFVFMADVHYQSTNIGTKQKAPPFYT